MSMERLGATLHERHSEALSAGHSEVAKAIEPLLATLSSVSVQGRERYGRLVDPMLFPAGPKVEATLINRLGYSFHPTDVVEFVRELMAEVGEPVGF